MARYDDELVSTLEKWERYTRYDEDGVEHMGKRKKGTEHVGEESLGELFKDGKGDSTKMVRSFARMGLTDAKSVVKSETEVCSQTVIISSPFLNPSIRKVKLCHIL